jgi:adenylate cyclase
LLWPILQISILLTVNYIFVALFKYLNKNKENRYIKQAFSRYLSHKLLGELLINPDKLSLGGETRNMTVLFSDIRSFTTISEGLTSAELVSMLNDYLDYMTNIILDHEGTIDKYIGDAIMAFWNAPLDEPDHATKGILAALDMQKQVEEFVQAHPEYPEIKIGIGVNTGDMTVGNVGGSARFDYTVLGDNVNLGARLEGLTKKYGVTVLCTQSAMDQFTGQQVLFRLLDEVRVKGKTSAVKIYEPMFESEVNLKLKQVYAEAFELYQQAEFAKAAELLKKTSNLDAAAKKLQERSEQLVQSPPAKWEGIWNWEEK